MPYILPYKHLYNKCFGRTALKRCFSHTQQKSAHCAIFLRIALAVGTDSNKLNMIFIHFLENETNVAGDIDTPATIPFSI